MKLQALQKPTPRKQQILHKLEYFIQHKMPWKSQGKGRGGGEMWEVKTNKLEMRKEKAHGAYHTFWIAVSKQLSWYENHHNPSFILRYISGILCSTLAINVPEMVQTLYMHLNSLKSIMLLFYDLTNFTKGRVHNRNKKLPYQCNKEPNSYFRFLHL